jgi:hypothetical protein
MKQNRTHYTWNTKKPNNCFNSVHLGFKASKQAYSPKQSISILALLALAALFAKLKDI